MLEPTKIPRILYLTPVLPYPPAVAGDAVYSRGVIEAWSQVADLTVLCCDSGAHRDSATTRAHWHIVDRQRHGRVGSLLSRFPLVSWKGATKAYRRSLRTLLRDSHWDAIVLDNLGLAFALPQASAFRKNHQGSRLIYVSIEWEYPTRASKYSSYGLSPLRRIAASLDLRKVRRWENALIRRSDIVTVINLADADAFRAIDSAAKYVPLLPGYDGPVTASRAITENTPRRVLILGGRRSEQKQQVLLDWLEVSYDRLLASDIETVVIGDIPSGLRIRVEAAYPRVRVEGFVDDLEAAISAARAGLIVDTVGGGFKLRLLSHVFQRLPIIGLRDAISGLPTPEGEGFLASSSLEELAELVCTTIDKADVLNSVQERAFADCSAEFSWNQRAAILQSLLDGSRGLDIRPGENAKRRKGTKP